jgi:hypothetical protein
LPPRALSLVLQAFLKKKGLKVMDELLSCIELVIGMELERANKINKPKFNSNHEGWAVILEELQEAEQEMNALNENMR